ncbi:glutamine synthetase III [candidate division KSB1 bacterium]|nr:glutamine synthetase III [candidate division KSB1 bacterium]
MPTKSISAELRKKVLIAIAKNGAIDRASHFENASSYYGVNTFNNQVMREKLPKDIYEKLINTIHTGHKLDMGIANSVAHAMKEWAISKGVTHFTHWFQPQTGLTAEKHDAFLEFDRDGTPLERFRGNQLVQGEPDASSFPSGGRRTTFEARGYTMWDPSSPAFIIEGPRGGILCVPSVFISYNGEALDKKTPLLRSMETINKAALKVLRLFGNEKATRVVPTIGTEQEYFLIDQGFFNLRPDLQITSRTLMGARPPKGQQLDDHYFGSIKERALAFMQDSEKELYKLGVPAKTRHNEVAPHQYELAPIYGEANVGSDRNQLIMEMLKKIANRHKLALLLHEKPFAGINGSGKHNNWSMEDSEGNNLLDPGKTPEENLQFLVFLVATLRAVHRYGDLLRATVASAANDHRLGANEAPPAIMSVFLGVQLSSILDDIKAGRTAKATDEFVINLGLGQLPHIMRDNTDRNRTSPFAFTGSKFEFRAIGSSASVSQSNTMLNAAVAESLNLIAEDIAANLVEVKDIKQAVLNVLQKYITETEPIRYEGNNYSEEWEKEAVKRGLSNVKRSGYALDALVGKKNMDMLLHQSVYSKEELESRYITKLEQYIMALEIETETYCELVQTRILPVALTYQKDLIDILQGFKNLGSMVSDIKPESQIELLKNVSHDIESMQNGCKKLRNTLEKGSTIEDLPERAKYFSDHIVDLLEESRKPVDRLEGLVPDDLWPLPKYSEMLFIM